jgi:hypothetical protein
LTLAEKSIIDVFSKWELLTNTTDYGTHNNILWGTVREATAETIARSFIAAVPLIINNKICISNTSLLDFYVDKLVFLATNTLYAPTLNKYDQLTVEVAGICSCLLMLEHHNIDILGVHRPLVYTWVKLFTNAKIMNNNWIMFIMIIYAWLNKQENNYSIPHKWDLINNFYVGNGNYKDGPSGPVDYYTSWAFQWYSLVLAYTSKNHINFYNTISERALLFSEDYTTKILTSNLPTAGRSQCYREAASAALGLVALALPNSVPSGNRILEINKQYHNYNIGFIDVKKDFYSCRSSYMWAFKWYWQAIIPDDDMWWKIL